MKKISILLIFSLFFSLLLVQTVSALPTEVWVDGNGPDNGVDRFDTIQEGIDGVEAGGKVHVAAGTYILSSTIYISQNVSLLGAGETTTYVDGNQMRRIIYTDGLDSSTLIDGFTFRNGFDFDHYGAGMYNFFSSPTVTNCTFSGNKVLSENGGGMCNFYSSPKVTNCTFSGNTANYYGGGMCNLYDSSTKVTNCMFSGNTARYGGGIYDNSSSPTVTNCIFSGNTADYGGGMDNVSSQSTLTNCTFSGNTADYGGGIYDNSSTQTLTNCIFSGNTADYGGGMYNVYSQSTLTNCTFSGNTADYGGGMYNYISSPTVTNCIIWGNTPNSVQDYESSPTITYSDVEGGYIGSGNIDADPMFVNIHNGNLRLKSSSPCIDSGTDASSPAFGSVIDDIEGTVRPQQDEYDMGAYECVITGWSPIVMKPLVANALMDVNSLWECLLQELPEEVSVDVQSMLEDIQAHIENAAMLSNPVYANGGLYTAMALMKQINDALGCGCNLD